MNPQKTEKLWFLVHFEGQKHGLLNLEAKKWLLNPKNENFDGYLPLKLQN